MWDERYSADGYVFGQDPAAFLQSHSGLLKPGNTALAVADGEGRNSVFIAQQGLEVTAMDASEIGVAKARQLAAERSVVIDFQVADILEWKWEPESFDVVAAVFIQFLDPDQRATVFAGMQRTLRAGGLLLLHGYRPKQLEYGTGGPPIAEYLYTEELLADSFANMSIERLASYDAEISEGTGHVGMSALIDLVATKP